MRWFWFDRFTEFEPGRRAVAVKCVTLAEEHLHDHWAEFPVMPPSLMIEGMAQTAGILVGEARQFREKVILAKIKRAELRQLVRPGSRLRYEADVESLSDGAASTRGRVFCDDAHIGDVDLVFSHVDNNISGLEFPQENFVFTEEFMGLLRSFRPGQPQGVAL